MSLLDKWNKNKFTVYDSEQKTVLKLLQEISNWLSDFVVDLSRKTDLYGDHKGSWQGINRPTQTDIGLAGTVEKIIDKDLPSIYLQLNDLNKRKEDVVNLKELGLIEGVEYVDYTYNDTNTKLDTRTRSFVNNQTDYAKENNRILQEALLEYRRVYIPKGNFVFCDYDETTKEGYSITVPDNTEIYGDGVELTNLHCIRLRGSTSNVKIHDIKFNGLTDVTPIGKLKIASSSDFSVNTDFDYTKYNIHLKRPDINYNTPIIFSPNFENKEIENINIYNCEFENVTSGVIVGDHLGTDENKYNSKNITMTNCKGNNLIYHLLGLQKTVNVNFTSNYLYKSYVGMLLDSSRDSKNILFDSNIADKCLNLAKLEVSRTGNTSKNEVMSNNVYISWGSDELNYDIDYVVKVTGDAQVFGNIFEINSKFDEVFSVTQTINGVRHLIKDNIITINNSMKSRNSRCNTIFRIYSHTDNITEYDLYIKDNKVNVVDVINCETLRFIDCLSTVERNFKPNVVVENNSIDNICEYCFIDTTDLKNIKIKNNKIKFVEGYFNVLTLVRVGDNLKNIIINDNDIEFTRGCILNTNYFGGTIKDVNNDLNIIIEGNKYVSKYSTAQKNTYYTEDEKTQFIHLSNFVTNIKLVSIKRNITNLHENMFYISLNSLIDTLIVKDNVFEFIGRRTGVSALIYGEPVNFGVFTNNDFITKGYTVELDGNNKIIWNNNYGVSEITVNNILAS